MKKQLFILFAILLGMYSQKSFSQNGSLIEAEYGYVLKNVNYLQYFQGEEYMDVYLSYNASPSQPFVILIHGGGFTGGDKKQMEELAMELLKNDISSVSLNYSLLSKKYFKDNNRTTYQTMLNNIWNSIQHIQLKSGEWNVRNKGYVILGEEVGGYLSLLSGYNFHSEVESIIAISALTDLRDIGSFNRLPSKKGQDKILFTKLVGGESFKTSKFLSNTYINASPIDQVKDIPTILIHGVKNQIIPYSQSAKLYTFLKNNNVYTKIYNVEHGGSSLLSDPHHKDQVTEYIIKWLKYKK